LRSGGCGKAVTIPHRAEGVAAVALRAVVPERFDRDYESSLLDLTCAMMAS